MKYRILRYCEDSSTKTVLKLYAAQLLVAHIILLVSIYPIAGITMINASTIERMRCCIRVGRLRIKKKFDKFIFIKQQLSVSLRLDRQVLQPFAAIHLMCLLLLTECILIMLVCMF